MGHDGQLAGCPGGSPVVNGAGEVVGQLSGGAGQNGTPPTCQNGDGCCPAGCDSGNDDDCVSCNLGQLGESCVDNADCCSNKCKGRAGNKTSK